MNSGGGGGGGDGEQRRWWRRRWWWTVVVIVEEVAMVEVEVEVLASEHYDCVIHSCNNNFFLLIQFVAIDILVLVL